MKLSMILVKKNKSSKVCENASFHDLCERNIKLIVIQKMIMMMEIV